MRKIKKQYRSMEGRWYWSKDGIAYEHRWVYFRSLSGIVCQNKRNCWDQADCREDRIKVKYRRKELVNPYDDFWTSRGYYVRSWKDATKRKKQWIGR